MAYTAPPSKDAGDTLTETNWNTHIKANFEAGVPDIFTTKGDLAAATGADAAARLGIGNDDDTLVPDASQATGLAWQTQPACRVYNDANINPANSSWESLTFNTERLDTNAMHSLVSNTNRLTVPTGGGGLYLIGGHVEFDSSATGTNASYRVRILLNGATILALAEMPSLFTADVAVSLTTFYSLSATDYVELQVYTPQDVVVLATANYSPEFWAIWQRRQ